MLMVFNTSLQRPSCNTKSALQLAFACSIRQKQMKNRSKRQKGLYIEGDLLRSESFANTGLGNSEEIGVSFKSYCTMPACQMESTTKKALQIRMLPDESKLPLSPISFTKKKNKIKMGTIFVFKMFSFQNQCSHLQWAKISSKKVSCDCNSE